MWVAAARLVLPGSSSGRLSSRNFSATKSLMASKGRLQGKVAIVTASTDGIGLGIAKRLLDDGCAVMISSRKEANVRRAVEDFRKAGFDDRRLSGMTCHVGKAEDRSELIHRTVQKMGGIDILVSNAAANPHFGNMIECPESAWDKIFETNVKAAFLLTQLAVPEIKKRGGGSVVYVASIAGYQSMPGLGAYSVSKTTLLGLSKALSNELASEGIRFNCVAPGIVPTKFASAITSSPEVVEKTLEFVPAKRLGTPADMGGAVAFLCSEDSSYMTGETLVVAGGMHARL